MVSINPMSDLPRFGMVLNLAKIGNYWFHSLCKQRSIDSISTFNQLVIKHIGSELRGPFNIEARKLADFSDEELDYLQARSALSTT